MFTFNFVDLFLAEVWDILNLGDAQGLALGEAPAFQAVFNLLFISLHGGLVKVSFQEGPGQVLLR
jgi:hypothetical protein